MNIYLRLIRFAKPYWGRLIFATLCTFIVAGLTTAIPGTIKWVVDYIFVEKDAFMLIVLPIGVTIIFFLKGVFTYLQSYLMKYVGNRAVMDIRNRLYNHLVFLPLGFHTKNPTGKLMSKIMNDVGMMQVAVSSVMKDLLQHTVTAIGMIGVIFYLDWKLATISLLVLPLVYYPLVKMGRRLRKLSRKGQEKIADLSAVLQETLSGIKIVKAFGMEGHEGDRFADENRSYFNVTMKGTKLAEVTSPMMEVIGALGFSIILWYGGYQVIKGNSTPGTFFAFLTALQMLYGPIKSLSNISNTIQQTIAAAERVFQILDISTEKDMEKGSFKLLKVEKGVEFENISFLYEESKEPVLKNINLNVKAGEVIALVGSSGSGKTTLVNLLPRFYDPAEGRILIDGIDIKEATLSSLRGQISIVSQDVILFNDAVRNNIAYGKENATLSEVMEAARAAYAHQFISKLPQGYDTVIGEKGIRLSGGEKQRLAIARAILKNSPILILDEATSSLDTESEFYVQKALENLMKNRTTLVIAHRLSTVKNADRIVVIEDGKIVEIGRHEELLKNNGSYNRLYRMQFIESESAQNI